MNAYEKKRLKQTIEEEIAQLHKQIANLEAKSEPVAPDCSLGRLTRMEAISEQEVNKKILETSKLRLTRLQNALGRIDTPMFGICIECDEPIGIGRLQARPESVRCIECATEREANG